MPISKEQQKLYPKRKEWEAIRARILARAEYRCECTGQCDLDHAGSRCSAPQHALVRRSDNKLSWSFAPEKPWTRIVLTIAHFPDRTPSNVAPENLLALCQLCHLRADRFQHAANAARTKASRKHGTPVSDACAIDCAQL